jgi:hypothetical protein
MRNVYERWGPILHPSLRMACGSSTLAYCHETETNRIWDNYNNKGYDVADSFIDGLHRYDWNTPLCITTGGLFASGTPLFDQQFTSKKNKSGQYYHIQFLSNFASTAPIAVLIEIPKLLAIYDLIPMPLPGPYRDMNFRREGAWTHSVETVEGRESTVKINADSGAIYLVGVRRFDDKQKLLDEEEYVKAANAIINQQGFAEKYMSEPVGTRMVIDRIPIRGKISDIARFQKNVILTFKRYFYLEDKMVNFVGEGGVISIQLNNDGSILNATKVWRTIKGIKRMTPSKDQQQALREALEKIKDRSAYRLADWTWGYKEEAGNVKQTELKAVYIFNFLPVDQGKAREFPPRIIEISAHVE